MNTALASIGRRRCLVLAGAVCLAWPQAAPARPTAIAAARDRTFSVERDGERLRVLAAATLSSDVATAWRTLTDYEHLPEFIPGMQSSRALERAGDDALVVQSGIAGWGPVHQPFRVTMRVHETPMREVTARAVDGDFEQFESRYRLQPDDAGSLRLDYDALLKPRTSLPPLVGLPVLRMLMRQQFAALLDEIERRGAVRDDGATAG